MANEQAIRNRRGSLLTTIKAGRTNTTATSLVLHGYGASEYGQLRDTNLVHLLENFYNSAAPENPMEGQLWWRSNDQLYVWTLFGSPEGGMWDGVVPPADELGFTIIAGAGLTGGGLPTLSPAEVVLNVGAGTGIRVGSPKGFITVKESEIDHDSLLNSAANDHIDHSLVILTAGTGLTGGGDLTASRTFTVGAGDGIVVSADVISVDSTIIHLTGSPQTQTIDGLYLWADQMRGDGDESDPSVAVAFTFVDDLDTGVLRTAANTLGFATGGTTQFEIQNNGVLQAQQVNYETLLSDDDDIPNKAYVDSLAGSGVSPTENTIVGVNTITGMTPDKKYLVNVFGYIPSKGNTNFTLDGVVLRTGTTAGAGTILDFTNNVTINWCDGSAPIQVSFIADLSTTGSPSATSVNCRISPTVDIYVSREATYMTAVQLN